MRPLKLKTSDQVRFSPGGDSCLTLARDVSLWSISARKKSWRCHPFPHPSHGAFSPDGRHIAVKNTAGRIVLLDSSTGEVERDFENQAEGEGSNVCFSLSGEELVDGSWDGLLTVRKVSSGEISYQHCFEGELICRVLHASRAGFWLTEHHPRATEADKPPLDGYFLKWSWPIGDSPPDRLDCEFPFIRSSSLTPCGTRLALVYGAPPTTKVVVDVASQSEVWSQEVAFGGTGGGLRWSPCGRHFGVVQDGRIATYSGADGTLLATEELEYPSDVDYSSKAAVVAYGSKKNGILRQVRS